MKTVIMKQDMESYASAFRQGINSGMTNLFDAWYFQLCDFVGSMTHERSSAEEIASEAFLKTWKYREQFCSAGEIRAYLFTVARRDAFKWIQRKRKAPRMESYDQIESITSEIPEIVHQETRAAVSKAIQSLPPRCRRIFEMMYQEGKNTEEIATELLISPYTVRAQKARGLSLLRPKLLTTLDNVV